MFNYVYLRLSVNKSNLPIYNTNNRAIIILILFRGMIMIAYILSIIGICFILLHILIINKKFKQYRIALPTIYSTLVIIEILFAIDKVGSVGYIMPHILILLFLWVLYMRDRIIYNHKHHKLTS